VKVRDNHNIPGTVGQQPRLENVEVTREVGDRHFHDFSREEGGQFSRGTHAWGSVTEGVVCLYFAPIPNGLCCPTRQTDCYALCMVVHEVGVPASRLVFVDS